MAHHNVILDGTIGEHIWFGGYSGTAISPLDKKNVMFQAGHKSVDTEASRFGVVVGNNSAIGTAVIIPGREVPSNSVIHNFNICKGVSYGLRFNFRFR